jgi:hypothetical protein
MVGVRCGDSEAVYYPSTGQIVVKQNAENLKSLDKANAALDALMSQPVVSKGIKVTIKSGADQPILMANASSFQKLLAESRQVSAPGSQYIQGLVKKYSELSNQTINNQVREQLAYKLSVVESLSGTVTPDLTKAETEAYYNRMTEGAERLRNLTKGTSPQNSPRLVEELDQIYGELANLNRFHPQFKAIFGANKWLIDNFTHDGLTAQLQTPAGRAQLSTSLFSSNAGERQFAHDIRSGLNMLILKGQDDSRYFDSASLFFAADQAFASGDKVKAQRLYQRALDFESYLEGELEPVNLSPSAYRFLSGAVNSSDFFDVEATRIANELAESLANNTKADSETLAATAREALKLARNQTNVRSAFFHLDAASDLIDQINSRQDGYFNNGVLPDQGYVRSNEPIVAKAQIEKIKHAYRAVGLNRQADRMEEFASSLGNFNAGNSLPYQGVKLSDSARSLFDADFTSDEFLGYQSVLLFNTFATSRSIVNNEGYRAIAVLLAASMKARSKQDLAGGFRDLEQGWSLLDVAEGFATGLYTSGKETIEGMAQLIFHPIDTTVGLAMAIYNYEEPGKAILDSIVASYETLKECDKNPPVCAELIGKITGDIAHTLVPVSKIGQGAKLVASARVAAIAETRVGQAIVKAGAKLGFQSGAELKTLISRIQEVSPCSLASHPVEKDKFKVLWAIISRVRLVPIAYGNIRSPCRSLKLSEAKELIEGLSKIGGIDSKKALDSIYGAKDAIAALGPKEFGEILNTPKGSRKLPSEYLPQTYIDAHLAKFDKGGSRFMIKDNLETWGPGQHDGTSFLMPKGDADAILALAKGNRGVLEEALGFKPGALAKFDIVRVDFPRPKDLNLRLPSGNEAGASELWLPGGKLPTGASEAVIDVSSAAPGSWTSTTLNF